MLFGCFPIKFTRRAFWRKAKKVTEKKPRGPTADAFTLPMHPEPSKSGIYAFGPDEVAHPHKDSPDAQDAKMWLEEGALHPRAFFAPAVAPLALAPRRRHAHDISCQTGLDKEPTKVVHRRRSVRTYATHRATALSLNAIDEQLEPAEREYSLDEIRRLSPRLPPTAAHDGELRGCAIRTASSRARISPSYSSVASLAGSETEEDTRQWCHCRDFGCPFLHRHKIELFESGVVDEQGYKLLVDLCNRPWIWHNDQTNAVFDHLNDEDEQDTDRIRTFETYPVPHIRNMRRCEGQALGLDIRA